MNKKYTASLSKNVRLLYQRIVTKIKREDFKKKFLLFVGCIFLVWSFLAFLGIWQFDLIFPEHIHSLILIEGIPYKSVDVNKIDFLKIHYTSDIGAFIAGEKCPIDARIEIKLSDEDFIEKIDNDEIIFNVIFNGASKYPLEISELGISTGGTNDFKYDSNKKMLEGDCVFIYYLPGEYMVKIIIYDKKAEQYIFVSPLLETSRIYISPPEAGLQIYNNRRIFALTLAIIGFTLIALFKKKTC